MIWVGGRVVPDDALSISVRDRSFEHGLGLFETIRTWDGRAPLLDRHLARLSASAAALGLPLDPAAVPDASAVAALLKSDAMTGDAMIRLTLSGGLADGGGSTLWMRPAPLPTPMRTPGAVVALGTWEVAWSDPLARHKTLNYWTRRLAFEQAGALGFDEAVGRSADGRYWDGSRTSVFLVIDDQLATASLDGPIVPGVMRGLVLDRAEALSLEVVEEEYPTLAGFEMATEMFLCNAVRGIVPVARAGTFSYKAPGPWTRRLAAKVKDWVKGGNARR